jgi:hypothetical protein
MFLQKDGGNIGIGGTATNAKVHIHGGKSRSSFNFGWLKASAVEETGYTYNPSGNPMSYSLWGADRIGAHEFHAFSDARIKNIQGISNAQQDLVTLLQIKITDYLYKDLETKGDTPQKKVIGQQVAEVYPQAVSTANTRFVPDVLHNSFARDSWIEIPNHTLKKGDLVRLVFKEKTEEVAVLSVKENAILTESTRSGKVVVYGRQVTDFHVVDYTALAMLNISATQELARQIELLKQQVEETKVMRN